MKKGIPRFLRYKGYSISMMPTQSGSIYDDNDIFVLKKVLIYLHRIIGRYFILDEEFVDILCWAMHEDIVPVVRFLLDFLPENELESFHEEILKDHPGFAPDHLNISSVNISPDPEIIMELLKAVPQKNLLEFGGFLRKRLLIRHDALGYNAPCEIEKNLTALKQLFKLSDPEIELCTFLFVIEKYGQPQSYFSHHLECYSYASRKYLKCIIDLDAGSFHELTNGTLKQACILDQDSSEIELDDNWLSWLEYPSDDIFTRRFYSSLPKSDIPLDLHFIDKGAISHILKLLKPRKKGHEDHDSPGTETADSLEHKPSSTHILLYGHPGSGKTSFARGIAARLTIPAYGIMQGKDNKSTSRQSAIRACINMTSSDNGALIVVDEADNLLNTQLSWLHQGETRDKGWLNQLLDEPCLRMIWISNDIEGIEPSVLRRFSFSIHFKPFNRRQRYQLWKNAFHRYGVPLIKDRKAVGELARRYHVSAGGIDLAVRKAAEGQPMPEGDILKSICLTLDAHETLMNEGEPPEERTVVDKSYSLDGLTIDGDVARLMEQLEKFDKYLRSGKKSGISNINILLYGPPGSGKSELGRYIAQHLDRSVICRDISEIQSKYVGDSEKNIREAFEEAQYEDAVLIFDEVDTLLFNRSNALRSWEISFTNAFLTRMERFRGILICTTNLVQGLDGASIRRFNHKIKLDCLKGEGNIIFYKKMIAPLV
ncbi:MAG: ATP-binding protein, partial [Desulfamplus sp.]|nr:ATP-binding protein [Desulfamplus sp.]